MWLDLLALTLTDLRLQAVLEMILDQCFLGVFNGIDLLGDLLARSPLFQHLYGVRQVPVCAL